MFTFNKVSHWLLSLQKFYYVGIRDYSNKRIPLLGQENNALTWLIIINSTVFILLNFLKIIYFFSEIPQDLFQHQIVDWFSLPASFVKLASRPWVVFTFMFSHLGVWDLISTLLWVWGFGYILQDLTGNSKLLPIYIYGGVFGAVFFLLTNNIFPVLAMRVDYTLPLMGAGSSVMAVAVATTTLAPDYRIFPMINGGIPLWVLTVVFVAIDYATIASGSSGMAVAHLAGGAIGFVYIKQLNKGNDWGVWMINFMNWIDNLFNPEKKEAGISQKDRLYYKNTQPPFVKTTSVTQQRLDDILDKINQQGYNMLTDDEKAFLKKVSKEEL